MCKLQGHNIVKCGMQNINDSDKQKIERKCVEEWVSVWV